MEQEINDWASELNFVQVSLDKYPPDIFIILCFVIYLQLVEELDGGEHAAVRVGAATTNLQMLNWSNK